MRAKRFCYIVGSYLAFAVLFPFLALHPKTRAGLWQRLGRYPAGGVAPSGSPRIWFHGASAGDLLSLLPIIQGLRERLPGASLIVSTTTNSGHAMAQRRLSQVVNAVVYAPYDLWGATRQTVRALRPDLLVLEYAELWPNLVSAARRSGCRVALTNGRFSPGRVRGYQALFALAGNLLQQIDLLLMRAPEEAERALTLGAPPERVRVTGNTKFDALTPAAAQPEDGLREALGLTGPEPVFLAGSTHEGEEALLLDAYRRLLAAHPSLKLVLAPRYADRAARVEGLAASAGFTVRRRSAPLAPAQVVILDTVGELARAYRLATVVFVGGSFTQRGGQNILEPAAQGRPVLFGPHMENFRDSVQVLLGRGGVQVTDVDHLVRVAGELLDRPEAAQGLGALAEQTVRQVSGAGRRNVEALLELLIPPRGPALLVHPHLHRRRTGVTSHVEAMLGALQGSREALGFGSRLSQALPRLGLSQLLGRLRQGRAVWHAHRNNELLLGILLRVAFPDLRVVFTRHAARAPGAWTRFLARRADRLVVLTPEMARSFTTPSAVVPHGVDLARFAPPADRGQAWQALGQGGLRGVGVVGRIRPDKGQRDFARAWAAARHPDWRAVLVGSARGKHRRFLTELQTDAGAGFSAVGEQTDVAAWYRGLTVLVQPSRSEGFSLVLLEALASGCCVVAARLPHFPRWIEHGRTGFLYPPGDIGALTEQLRLLFTDPEEALAVGARAAERARAEMGVEQEVSALVRIYDGLAGTA